MNFALMFALALGIDYALFVVYRFRAALLGQDLGPAEATGVAMDTAGKAVLFSGVTVLISLTAVMLVPSPAFRSMSLGIMLAVIFVLAATLTLLPAVLAKLGPRVDRLAPPVGPLRRTPLAGLRALGGAPLAPSRTLRSRGGGTPRDLGRAGPRARYRDAVDQGRPRGRRVAPRIRRRPGGLRPRRAGCAPGAHRDPGRRGRRRDPYRRSRDRPDLPPQRGDGGTALIQAIPAQDPSDPAVGETIDRLREALPAGALVGGAAAENHDLEQALAAKTPLVIGTVLGLGFLLLLVALQAPLVAALGGLTNLLATGAAFGAGKLIFQDGNLEGLLGFSSQGFVNAWAPVFFFAMIFAIAMDYTVFLLSSAKEHWDRTRDPHEAMVGGVAHSGRVVLAAAAVMVAVFFTFALSGPLPPKEMGVILGIAVLLDAFLVRLVLVPVLLRVAGRWAWWLPGWLDRFLPDVRFGHASA